MKKSQNFIILEGKRSPILNSEDIIINQIGYDPYEKFFKYYTKKQWICIPMN